MKRSGIIYYYEWHFKGTPVQPRKTETSRHHPSLAGTIGIGLLALSLGGLLGPMTPFVRLEAGYRAVEAKAAIQTGWKTLADKFTAKPRQHFASITAPAKKVIFTPPTAPDGSVITPVDTDFGLIIPKIGVNAKVIPAVNPTDPGEYDKALLEGVAHSSTSYFPNENGTVYLFSHSTSYDWFVKDLNAVFYLVKNLDTNDTVVLYYKGLPYTYRITEKKIVSPEAVAYLVPHAGARNLILQTCWPPGSTSERLLLFADLISDPNQSI